MSIMEKNLPIAESLSEGDKVRIVTSEGDSKQIDASEIGGGSGGVTEVILRRTYDGGYIYTSDATWQELYDYFQNGLVYFRLHFEDVSNISAQVAMIWRVYFDGTHYVVVSNIENPQYAMDLKCNNANGYPSIQID